MPMGEHVNYFFFSLKRTYWEPHSKLNEAQMVSTIYHGALGRRDTHEI